MTPQTYQPDHETFKKNVAVLAPIISGVVTIIFSFLFFSLKLRFGYFSFFLGCWLFLIAFAIIEDQQLNSEYYKNKNGS